MKREDIVEYLNDFSKKIYKEYDVVITKIEVENYGIRRILGKIKNGLDKRTPYEKEIDALTNLEIYTEISRVILAEEEENSLNEIAYYDAKKDLIFITDLNNIDVVIKKGHTFLGTV